MLIPHDPILSWWMWEENLIFDACDTFVFGFELCVTWSCESMGATIEALVASTI